MPLFFEDRTAFATGYPSNVYDEPTSGETKSRLVLRVAIEGRQTLAMVDTGGVYLFCMPSLARDLGLHAAEALGEQTLIFREERVRGTLHRLTLTIFTEEGEDTELDTTAFVPHPTYENVPELPSILGLQGCLDRLRFAFDPKTDTFYFGPPD